MMFWSFVKVSSTVQPHLLNPPFLRTLLPGTFEGNIRIRKLWLSHNPGIRSLAGYAFPAIPHLRTVDLVCIR